MQFRPNQKIVLGGFTGGKVKICSGFSRTVLDSYSFGKQMALSFDGANLLACEGPSLTEERIYKVSGANVLASFTYLGYFIRDLAWDGLDLYAARPGRIYKFSGFSNTLITSFSSGGISDIRGLTKAFDSLYADDSSGNKVYRLSGVNSKNTVTSFPEPATNALSLDFDGRDLLLADTTSTDIVYKMSGVSGTVKDSFTYDTVRSVGYMNDPINSMSILHLQNTHNLLVAYNSGQTSPNFIAKTRKYQISSDSWDSEVSVDTGNTGYTYPALAQISSTDRNNPNRVILAMRDKAAATINFYFSDDGGDTWSSLSTLSVTDPSHLSLAVSNGRIVLVYQRGNTSYSRYSTNNGVSWSSETLLILANTTRLRTPSVSVLGNGQFIVGAESHPLTGKPGHIRILKSGDGSSWTDSGNVIADGSKSFYMTTVAVGVNGKVTLCMVERLSDDLYMSDSTDNGITFSTPYLINSNRRNGYLKGFFNPALAYYFGSLYLLTEGWDGSASDLVLFKGGEWTELTKQTQYREMYFPSMGNPEDLGWESLSKGSPSVTNSGGILTVETSGIAEKQIYKKNLIGNTRTSDGMAFFLDFSITNGGFNTNKMIYFRFVIYDSDQEPKSRLEFELWGQGSAISLYDRGATISGGVAGAPVLVGSTMGPTSVRTNILIAIKNDRISVWQKLHTDKTWTQYQDNQTLNVGRADLLLAGVTNDRIYLMSGITASVRDSFGGITNPLSVAPIVASTRTDHVISNSAATGKVYRVSGFTNSIINSFTITPSRSGLAWDGADLWSVSRTNNRVYKHSGFSRTIITSFTAADDRQSIVLKDPLTLLAVGLNTSTRVYTYSGVTNPIISSFGAVGGTNWYTGLAFDGHNILASNRVLDRIHIYSGQSGTLKTSFAVPDTEPRDIALQAEPYSSIEFGVMDRAGTQTLNIYGIAISTADDDLSEGFTNPTDLQGRLTSKDNILQYVHSGVSVQWGGSAGVVGDAWDIEPGYQFAKENIIDESPRDYWRSNSDGLPINIVLDAGAGKTFDVDQIALLGINFKYCRVQLNDTDAWGSPAIDQFIEVSDEDYAPTYQLTENAVTRGLEKATITSGMLSSSGLVTFNATACVDNAESGAAWVVDTTTAQGSYIQIDLGSGNEQELIQARIWTATPAVNLRPEHWGVYYSDDGLSWTFSGGIVKMNDTPKIAGLPDRHIASWSTVGSHQYWRLVLINAPGGPNGNNYAEFEFFVAGTVAYKLNQFAQPNRQKYARLLHRFLFSSSDDARIFIMSGLSRLVVSSFASPSTVPRGLAFNGPDLISLDASGSTDTIYVHSGTSATIKDSFTLSVGNEFGLAYTGEKLITCDTTTFKYYVYSGVSKTLIDSFSSASASTPRGVAWDGQNLLTTEIGSPERVIKFSGISNVVVDSILTGSVNAYAIAWDGKNLWVSTGTTTSTLFKHSGFTSTIIASFTYHSSLVRGLTFDPVGIFDVQKNNKDTLTLDAALQSDGYSLFNNQFQIFGDRVTQKIPYSSYRFLRILIPPQKTADGYYKIGKFIAGKFYQSTKMYDIRRRESRQPQLSEFVSEEGQRFIAKLGETRESIQIDFSGKQRAFADELMYILDYLDWGKTPFVFVKDSTDLTDFLYGRISPEQLWQLRHRVGSIFDIEDITIEEEL